MVGLVIVSPFVHYILAYFTRHIIDIVSLLRSNSAAPTPCQVLALLFEAVDKLAIMNLWPYATLWTDNADRSKGGGRMSERKNGRMKPAYC